MLSNLGVALKFQQIVIIGPFIRVLFTAESLPLTWRFCNNLQLLVVQLYIAPYAPNNVSNGPSLSFIYHPTFYKYVAYADTFRTHGRLKLNTSYH